MSATAPPQTRLWELTVLPRLSWIKGPSSKGVEGLEKGGEEWKRRGPQELVHTPCPKSFKIPWLLKQNWSDGRGSNTDGKHHRAASAQFEAAMLSVVCLFLILTRVARYGKTSKSREFKSGLVKCVLVCGLLLCVMWWTQSRHNRCNEV